MINGMLAARLSVTQKVTKVVSCVEVSTTKTSARMLLSPNKASWRCVSAPQLELIDDSECRPDPWNGLENVSGPSSSRAHIFEDERFGAVGLGHSSLHRREL
ncbi:hypothetical protein CLAIMM_00061 [Cladophialophora immunda]|nr:hypothetical protein CLAIMM_00061 [Cladophialophora immunda]